MLSQMQQGENLKSPIQTHKPNSYKQSRMVCTHTKPTKQTKPNKQTTNKAVQINKQTKLKQSRMKYTKSL